MWELRSRVEGLGVGVQGFRALVPGSSGSRILWFQDPLVPGSFGFWAALQGPLAGCLGNALMANLSSNALLESRILAVRRPEHRTEALSDATAPCYSDLCTWARTVNEVGFAQEDCRIGDAVCVCVCVCRSEWSAAHMAFSRSPHSPQHELGKRQLEGRRKQRVPGPKSMQNDWPTPLKRAQHVVGLYTFGVRVRAFSASSRQEMEASSQGAVIEDADGDLGLQGHEDIRLRLFSLN